VPLPARLPDVAVTSRPASGGRVIYLHGFASSAKSTKAAYFAEQARAHGVAFACPDLNEPDFTTMTVTRMLAQVRGELAEAPEGPVTVMGSSLGGTLAILAAASFPAEIDRIVLLAPAVMFAKAGDHVLPPDRIEEWRRRGALPFFHYAYDEERLLNVEFYEDSLQYDAFHASFTQPALAFQGTRDALVDYRAVEAFAASRANVTLLLLDDDHQLIASLPRIWEGVQRFLGLAE
jgi:pimeloyl-ACP methyl ester carboxylesterase